MKRIITLGVITIMLFALSACSQNNTPEKAAENFVISLYTADPERMVDCVPVFLLRQMAQSYGASLDNKEGLINIMKSNIRQEDIRDCVITSVKRDNDSTVLDEYKDNLDNYGVTNEDLSKISEYCMVTVDAKVDDENIENIVFCVKYDDVWYAVDID